MAGSFSPRAYPYAFQDGPLRRVPIPFTARPSPSPTSNISARLRDGATATQRRGLVSIDATVSAQGHARKAALFRCHELSASAVRVSTDARAEAVIAQEQALTFRAIDEA